MYQLRDATSMMVCALCALHAMREVFGFRISGDFIPLASMWSLGYDHRLTGRWSSTLACSITHWALITAVISLMVLLSIVSSITMVSTYVATQLHCQGSRCLKFSS